MTSLQLPQTTLNLSTQPVSDLLERYQKTRSTLDQLLPELTQEELLDNLTPLSKPIESLQKQAYVYRCTNCRELRIVSELLYEDDLLHACDRSTLLRQGRLSKLCAESSDLLSFPLGKWELLGTGPLDDLLLWTHSLSLGLDNPFKGI
jgi:hypothetical protein